jgi:proteasome activator subunit 4
MLSTILPAVDGSELNNVLINQTFLVHFLPLSHPQDWLTSMFTFWESFKSSTYDDQWLELCARLAEEHVDPHLSHPRVVDELKKAAEQQEPPCDKDETEVIPVPTEDYWQGIRKDVGIFTDVQFSFIMSKCLRTMGKLMPQRAIETWY